MVGEWASAGAIVEGGNTDFPAKKRKGKERASLEATKASNSKGSKVYRTEFIHRGQPMMANASALKSASVFYSILGSSILPTDEEDLLGMSEGNLRNQAFHNLVKVVTNYICHLVACLFLIS